MKPGVTHSETPHRPAGERAADDEVETPSGALRVLIVDDNASDRFLVVRELRRAFPAVEPVEAVDEADFGRVLEAGAFDAVITDFQLRWSDGRAVLRAVKARFPECPVVMFTGTGSEEIAVAAMKEGLDDYVVKGARHYARLPLAVRGALERAAARRKAADAEERLRVLVDGARDYAMYLLDAGGNITAWNAGGERVFGWTEAEVVGRPVATLFPSDAVDEGHPAHLLTAAARGGAAEADGWRVRKDGSRFWGRGVLRALRDADGALTGFVKITRDDSARKAAEDQNVALLARERQARADAEAADRIKDEFLTTLSHELRTPLTAVTSWLALLRTGRLGAERTTQALATIDRNVKALVILLEDLLDVSRIVRGEIHLEMQPVDLRDVVDGAAAALRPTAEAKGVDLHVASGRATPPISGDPARLRQVLFNLLGNAVKFTPRGGRVDLVLGHTDGEAIISVRDTGRGIPPDFLPHVFERFRQADGSSTRTASGLGIGLAIVRHLVELHGGHVTAESDGPGRGATFTVVLPVLAVDTAADDGAEPRSEDSVDLRGLRVLLVEDNDDARESLRMLLEASGAVVRAVRTARDARATLRADGADVLVCDVALPDENGHELLASLHTSVEDRIPAIAVTGYAGVLDRQRALAAGFDAFLPKPCDPHRLAETIAALARRA